MFDFGLSKAFAYLHGYAEGLFWTKSPDTKSASIVAAMTRGVYNAVGAFWFARLGNDVELYPAQIAPTDLLRMIERTSYHPPQGTPIAFNCTYIAALAAYLSRAVGVNPAKAQVAISYGSQKMTHYLLQSGGLYYDPTLDLAGLSSGEYGANVTLQEGAFLRGVGGRW